jgi:D-alanyl-D-alanine carboxypeptidase
MKHYSFLFKMLLLLFIPLFFLMNCESSSSPTPPITSEFNAETIAKLNNAIEVAMNESYAPGSIVYASFPDRGEYLNCFGVCNLTTDEIMNLENHFRIGSITKTFTGTLALKLYDEGKIDLDESLSHYLPEYTYPKANEVTVRMLANMTSGIRSYTFDSAFVTNMYLQEFERSFTSDQLARVTMDDDTLLFAPGQGWNYSNTNTVLLGVICERVTGTSIHDLFKEKIFDAHGLNNTHWPLTRFLPEPYSHGYTPQTITGSMADATYYNPSWGNAAGILISNVYDLKKYGELILSTGMYSQKAEDERFKWVDTNHPVIPNLQYGFAIGRTGGWIGHTGELPGYNSCVFVFPPENAVIVVHVNSDFGEPAKDVLKAVARILTPENVPYE